MRVLVISAHPDDETLGCGGTLLKHRAAGDSLSWLIGTECYEPVWSPAVIERKAGEVAAVAEAYGMTEYFKLGFPAARLDTIPQGDVIDRIREVVAKVTPELIYLVHGGDVHTDHQIIFTGTLSVVKPFYMDRFKVRRILCYETISSTDAAPPRPGQQFAPNVFSNITPFMEEKLRVMNLYETETQADPLPRGSSAIRALARSRGATIGVEYAEAFMLIREMI